MIKKSTLENILSQDMAPLWNVLSPEEKRIIADNFTVQKFKKNQIIYAEREEPDYLWVLLEGKVKMYKSGIGERVQILRLYRPIQMFGYRAFFAEEPYVSTCAAFEPSTLGRVPLHLLMQLIQRNNQVALFFIRELSKNLGGSDSKLVSLTQKHLRGRLAEALLLLADNYGFDDDGATLNIYLSREDLANLSNMTTSNAIRTLTSFVTENLLKVDGRRIRIVDEVQLRKISKFG